MCGIGLILSGVDIVGCHGCAESLGTGAPSCSNEYQPDFVIDDLKAALQRRGPDNLSSKKIFLQLHSSVDFGPDVDGEYTKGDSLECCKDSTVESIISAAEELYSEDNNGKRPDAEMHFLGATLQLRGSDPIFQPLMDSSGNLLAYNGEIFGGIDIGMNQNDAEVLLHELEDGCSCECYEVEKECSCSKAGAQTIPDILSSIKGPWALIYWHEKTRTLWFGRDAFGRRSLLVHWPTLSNSRFALSSLAPASVVTTDAGSKQSPGGSEPVSDSEVACTYVNHDWEELPCGIYSIQLKSQRVKELIQNKKIVGEVRNYLWKNLLLKSLIEWDRASVVPELDIQDQMKQSVSVSAFREEQYPDAEDLNTTENAGSNGSALNHNCPGNKQLAEKVLMALRESVLRRTILNRNFDTSLDENEKEEHAPVAVLFSGGLDSMILSVLLDQCIDSRYSIDLLNVSFNGQLAPDRITAREGLAELKKIAPFRRWRLVEIDASLSDLTSEAKHLMSLIYPAKTFMDLNIGLALWLAAGGDGWVDSEICNFQKDCRRYRYKSTARVLLVGSGADEQCGGYGRHRTKFRLGGWRALNEEMRLDMQRIWKRNMGRDDRCISDQGKEARFPFLDENVIKTLVDIPLWEIVDLNEPVGRGDKKILRQVARLLGLEHAATLPKRAIQFGSRIARESNRKNFGSNRAANQASAGSVDIY